MSRSYVACPHNEADLRACFGCTNVEDKPHSRARSCEGEHAARISRGTEGDATVIGDLPSFWVIEDVFSSCRCRLTEVEWERVREQMIENYGDEDWSDADADYYGALADAQSY